jgi:hypothetical protein
MAFAIQYPTVTMQFHLRRRSVAQTRWPRFVATSRSNPRNLAESLCAKIVTISLESDSFWHVKRFHVDTLRFPLHHTYMGRTTSTVRAWALQPGDWRACGLSCDCAHDDGAATVARRPAERAPQGQPVRVAASMMELQDRVFGDCLWVY